MTSNLYAQAGYEALAGGMPVEKVCARLKEVLEAHGHATLYKESLRGILARAEKAESARVALVTVAKKDAEKHFSHEIKQFLAAQGIEHSEVVVDETIVGGFIVRGKGRELDASYKRSLLNIYRALTA